MPLIDELFDKFNTLELEVDGIVYEQFTDGSVSKSMENASGSFSFTATANVVEAFPIKLNDPVRVLVGGQALLTGFVTDVNVGYDAADHSITVSGRDKTGDLMDSSVIGNVQFNAPVKLIDICRRVITNLGLDVKVLADVGDIAPFAETELVAAERDMTAFDFLEKFARKRQVLLTSNGDGNLVITRGGLSLFKTVIVNEIDGENNNVQKASVRYNVNDRFNQVTFISQSNRTSSDTISGSSSQSGIAVDPEIRGSRQKIVISEAATDNLTCTQRAQWDVNLRRARGIEYRATLFGYVAQTETGDVFNTIWQPNQRCIVKDEFCDISSEMLIKEVTYNLSLGGGSTVDIFLVSPDAYTLETVRRAQKANEIGDSLT